MTDPTTPTPEPKPNARRQPRVAKAPAPAKRSTAAKSRTAADVPAVAKQPAIAKPSTTAKSRTAAHVPAVANLRVTAKSPAVAKPRQTRAAGAAMTSKRLIGLPARETPVPFDGGRESLEIARRVVEIAEDKKAADIVLLDIGALTTIADAFVVCSGGSERQLDAIADGILEGLRAEGIRPIGREGVAASHWVLLDFGGVIVHIFTPPERDFYQLEKHWSEARTVLQVQ